MAAAGVAQDDAAMPHRLPKETMMSLKHLLTWWHHPPAHRLPRPSAPDWVNGGAPAEESPPAELQRGCGWFDSSHELNAGLMVTEHASPEPVANEVPLGWWLDWQASGAPAPACRSLELH
jgi:hypothetical protein